MRTRRTFQVTVREGAREGAVYGAKVVDGGRLQFDERDEDWLRRFVQDTPPGVGWGQRTIRVSVCPEAVCVSCHHRRRDEWDPWLLAGHEAVRLRTIVKSVPAKAWDGGLVHCDASPVIFPALPRCANINALVASGVDVSGHYYRTHEDLD